MLRVETYRWMAADLGGENPQAIFRNPNPDIAAVAQPNLREREGLGRSCGRRVLPYRLQDRYNRDRKPRNFRAIILENEFLRAMFLPELGGRLMSLIHQPTGRELLFNNPVFQPANLALRDAWFAGGIEWNVGQFGHAFHTCAPVFAAAIPGGLRLYDFERCSGLFWQIDFQIAGEFLLAHTRILNPRDVPAPLYWWTNIAVPEAADVRVLAPTSAAITCDLTNYTAGQMAYGGIQLPGEPDLTYAVNAPCATEFYYQCQATDLPWEAALDGRGTGFIEASTQPLNTRKLFAWGMHQGGRHWQEFLSQPGQAYMEIQAGLAPTQIHGASLPARSEIRWTQMFGYIEADPQKVHGDWTTAWQTVDAALRRKLPALPVGRQWDAPPEELLQTGSGWGALEIKRRGAAISPALVFPKLDAEQQPWVTLLETGALPESDAPGSWMIQPEWRELLEQSQRRHWLAWLHLGVMRVEAFDDAGAQAAWEESLRCRPSAWAYRNLGALAMRRQQPGRALEFYRRAWELGRPEISLAQEYLAALLAAQEIEAAWKFYESVPVAEGLQVLAAKVAFARADWKFVAAVLEQEPVSLREGARDLTDLWAGLHGSTKPPAHIDFRTTE